MYTSVFCIHMVLHVHIHTRVSLVNCPPSLGHLSLHTNSWRPNLMLCNWGLIEVSRLKFCHKDIGAKLWWLQSMQHWRNSHQDCAQLQDAFVMRSPLHPWQTSGAAGAQIIGGLTVSINIQRRKWRLAGSWGSWRLNGTCFACLSRDDPRFRNGLESCRYFGAWRNFMLGGLMHKSFHLWWWCGTDPYCRLAENTLGFGWFERVSECGRHG